MIRLGIYITFAIILALGAVWFANNPGTLLFNWQGWEIRMSVAVFYLCLFLYTIAIWGLFKLYLWFRIDNPLTSPKRQESKRQKGLVELDKGWSALAIQDLAAALRHAKKAQGFLPQDHGPLRLLLKASPEKDAPKILKKLRDNPHTHMVALKYQLNQEISAKNTAAAFAILQEMDNLSPQNPWISQKIFEEYTLMEKWEDAREILTKLVKSKSMDTETQRHMLAVINHAQALEADLSNQSIAARDFAKQALKHDPTFIPAGLLLARHHIAQAEKPKAQKVLETLWKKIPHPELGSLFLELEPMESPSEKFRRIQKFTSLNAQHLHSLHLLVQIGLETEHWSEAKQALEKVISLGKATRKTYQLLGRLEILQKNDQQAANVFLAKADETPPNPQWHCKKCAARSEKYTPVCSHCSIFGTLSGDI